MAPQYWGLFVQLGPTSLVYVNCEFCGSHRAWRCPWWHELFIVGAIELRSACKLYRHSQHYFDYTFVLPDWFLPWLTRSRSWGGTILLHLVCITFIEFYNFWLVTLITSGWCCRHLVYILKLTICLFWCMGTSEARPSSQTNMWLIL
jgi:hypothetical protein